MKKKNGEDFTATGMKIFLLIMSLQWMSVFTAKAQQKDQYAFEATAEKIYLQTDDDAYINTGTVWFRSVVTDAMEHIPTTLSGVLYVELIGPDEKILEKKLISITNGTGQGFFELNKDYPEGTYLLRAYTEWNRNFGESFFFKKYIRVFAAGQPAANVIRDITIVEAPDSTRRIKASFEPQLPDAAHSKDLTLILTFDEKNDTIAIKKNGSSGYKLDYPVPAGCQFVTLRVETKNNQTSSRSIILTRNYTDLQFFPESGEMVQGLPCVVGFKALDSIGKGKIVSGEILDRRGEVITRLNSNRLGMGKFQLNVADSSAHYIARIMISDPSGDTASRLFPLPQVAAKGTTISAVKAGDKIRLRVASSYPGDDSLLVRASCRGVVHFDIKGKLKNGAFEFGIHQNSLPEGIIAFTVMNDSLQPVAERLVFNERTSTRLDLSVTADKVQYMQREETILNIVSTLPDGNPVSADVSVLALNTDPALSASDTKQHILSYFLLSSDLQGTIEDPAWYFSEDTSRHEALDALLLTQGWRRYNYTRTSGIITVQPEYTLTVSGKVTGGLFNNKQKKGINLTMMTFGKPPSVDTQVSDSLGRFSFPVNDLYQQTVNVLIQTTNKTGAKKDYTITLDKKTSPPVHFDHVRSVEPPDSMVNVQIKRTVNNKKIMDDYIARTEGITLGEVVVKSYAMTPERKKVTDRFGAAKTIIEGDDIRKNEAKWSYGLYSVLLFNYPDKIGIIRGPEGSLYARVLNGEITLVVIDGIPVQAYDYGLIPAIPPSEVKSFEIIEYARNFSQLYCEIFPTGCLNAPATGNVIAIYTYGKIGLFGANRAPGIMSTAIPVFSTPRDFYAPKYPQLKAEDWQKPDLRTLINWTPKFMTDSTGNGRFSFYNSDMTGKTKIVVEAISPNGEIGYQVLYIDVKKRQ